MGGVHLERPELRSPGAHGRNSPAGHPRRALSRARLPDDSQQFLPRRAAARHPAGPCMNPAPAWRSRLWLAVAFLLTYYKLWLTRGQGLYAIGSQGQDDRLYLELAHHLIN